jgi:hypothetical protein
MLFAVMLGAVSCNPDDEIKGDEATAAPSDEPTEEPTEKKTEEKSTANADTRPELNVLFIGNSYTYYNSLWTIFRAFATKAGYKVKVSSITSGGYTLEKFADPNDEQGKKVAEALDIKNVGIYDFVVLQEQSKRPALDGKRDNFYDATRKLCEKIRAIGAEPILYSTWARKEGSEDLASEDWTVEDMAWRLDAAYSAIGKELDVKVAHVGLAFREVIANSPEIELYDPDKTHPSAKGSYLAAATIMATMLECDPRDVEYTSSIDSDIKPILDLAAYNVTFNTPTIPEQYLTETNK